MRPLETVLLALNTLYLLWPTVSGQHRPPVVRWLPALTALIVFVHLAWEGYRWQMLPLYLLTLLLLAHALWGWTQPAASAPRRVSWGGALAGALLLVGGALPALLPVPRLPQPTGPYPVGTHTYEVTDPGRTEIYADQPGLPRRFLIQVWYPADPKALADADRARWASAPDVLTPTLSAYLGLPPFFLDHVALAQSNAWQDVRPDAAHGPYPLLLFSHGWFGFSAQSTFLMEELASHGYVVAAVQHPYGAAVTVFSDGSIAPNNPRALPDDAPSPEAYEAAAQVLVKQWAGDLGAALDFLTARNQADPDGWWTGLLDLERVGVFGHSTGGGATIQFCGTDARCKAGVTLDAFMRPVSPEVLDRGTPQPFLYLFSERWPFARNTELFLRYQAHVPPENPLLTLRDAAHYDFTDLPALSPIAPALGLKGPIPAQVVIEQVRTLTRTFFDAALRGGPPFVMPDSEWVFPGLPENR